MKAEAIRGVTGALGLQTKRLRNTSSVHIASCYFKIQEI